MIWIAPPVFQTRPTHHTPPRYAATTILHVDSTTYAAKKIPAITLQQWWEVLLRYSTVVDVNFLTPIWYELAEASRDDLQTTLEDACRVTARHILLSPPVITYWVATWSVRPGSPCVTKPVWKKDWSNSSLSPTRLRWWKNYGQRRASGTTCWEETCAGRCMNRRSYCPLESQWMYTDWWQKCQYKVLPHSLISYGWRHTR